MLSKTNYILFRDCPKNAWLKIHKPDIYYAHELSAFEQQIIETGNEVDLLAKDLFLDGEYQKQFEIDGFLAITDILTQDAKSEEYSLFQVKATNNIDKKTHFHDLAFIRFSNPKTQIKFNDAAALASSVRSQLRAGGAAKTIS